MSDSYSYIVELVDQISGPAKSAGAQLGGMITKLSGTAEAIAKSKKELEALTSATTVDEAACAKLASTIERQQGALDKQAASIRKAVDGAKAEESAMAKAASATEGAAKAHTEAAKPVADMGKKTFDAANAMAVGKETVVASITAMGNAFKSLAAGDVKGAVQGVTDAVAGMAKLLDLAVPGLGQAVSAVISIAGGLVGITAGLIQSGAAFALEAVQAKQAMLGMFDALGGGIVTGEQTEAMIDNLKAKTGVLKDELVEYTKTLMAMGETDLGKLETSITAMASATALMGKEGSAAFTGLKAKIEQATTAGVGLKLADKQLSALYKTGANVDDVAKKMGVSTEELRKQLNAGTVNAAKFGDALESALIDKGQGPLAKMTSSLPYLKKQFLESMGDIFEDIEVQPFLDAVKDLFKIFSQASPAGQALKAGIGGFFNQVFATATKVVPYVKSFLLDLVIYGLRAYIAIKPIVKAIADFATSATGASIVTTVLSSLWEVLKVVGIAVAVVVAVLFGLWAISIACGLAIWTLIGYVIGLASGLGDSIAAGVTAAITWLGSLLSGVVGIGAGILEAITGWVDGAAKGAADFVAGLANGIINGGAAVVGAVKGLASNAVGAFKGALGIASPSKVMAELGGHTTDGFAMGVEDGTADTQGALESAVAPPAAPEGGGGGGGGGGGINVYVTIQAGGANAGELLELLASQLADKLEELLMQKGGAPA